MSQRKRTVNRRLTPHGRAVRCRVAIAQKLDGRLALSYSTLEIIQREVELELKRQRTADVQHAIGRAPSPSRCRSAPTTQPEETAP